MNYLGIDLRTKDVKKLIGILKRLKTTVNVCDGGMYHEDINYSQVQIVTMWSEAELDDWLYNTSHKCDYVGTFKLAQVQGLKMKKFAYTENVYFSRVISGNLGEAIMRSNVNDALHDYLEGADFSLDFISRWYYNGALEYLKSKDVQTIKLEETSSQFDDELKTELELCLLNAYEWACWYTYFADFEEALKTSVEDWIKYNSIDYFHYTKTDKSGKKTKCDFYEADGVFLGFLKDNQSYCFDHGIDCTKINPDKIMDSRYIPHPENKDVFELFYENLKNDYLDRKLNQVNLEMDFN